ncbi:glycosyltransferase [Lichenihabitans sp. Uapishka_5]|uniref:O-linked N-acetylglucosamine transferase, SPINDLY family protein n=1 Tax=Lichenihabitans sp. Uapishka_5 TaxID=3037302 RepID=UPI0029E7E0D1|nr:tetratricopeptide repeat protein [Lichenihabitans sp. Uapishka_5]MDX7952977.1 glycosyltransferase [Lichenihabitans sp. Uapishka_5]
MTVQTLARALPSIDAPLRRQADALVRAFELPPAGPGAKLVALAVLALQHGMPEQATEALNQASGFHPDNTHLLMEIGFIHQNRRQFDKALAAFSKVVALRPGDVAVYASLGSMLIAMGRLDLSIQASRIGLSLDPAPAGLYINLASALRADKQSEAAWDAYRALLSRHPEHAAGLVDALHLRQHLNDWDGYAAHLQLALAKSFRLGFRVPPFSILAASDDPVDQLEAARVWVKRMGGSVASPLARYGARPEADQTRRLRIGYLSSDFHNHATALLIIEMLELRDRDRFEAIGYCTGNIDDGTLIRHRIISTFDFCYDIGALGDEEAARKIHGDGIDILIDLKGFTSGARTEILAYRPAPLQVNFLGYPGTMGAPFIDYIVADCFVIPPEREGDFDEAVVRLPDCYQPNDRKRPVWPEPYGRAQCGLPEQGFVFCSFNAPYKITPDMFDLWMRLLHRVPGAVLWLLEGHPTGTLNLHKEAEARGIARERIVIAPKLVTEQHLSRMRLGDLFLDSFPVTAHTTASDALWVGVPVLTCPGASFVSRVAGSLLHAMGVPDMIVPDLQAYEERAVALAHDPATLGAIRARIEANRLTAPLFDSARYTRHFEDALLSMAARMDAGLPVASFDVPPRPAAAPTA